MIEYLLENMWQVWSVVAVLCLILELTSGDFFIMSFAIGAVFAALGDAVGLNVYFQLALFALFSTLSIFFVRPVALRYFHKGEDSRVSNADALMGRQGRVVETIVAGGFGRVQIDGDVWKAKTADGKEISSGKNVNVVGRESTIITVSEINN